MKPQFTVILPTYNERENAPVLVRQILELKTEADLRILVVDDDSPDGTADVVKEIFGSHDKVKVINRAGLSRGLVNSLNHAIDKCETEFIIWMDADLQMPAALIPELVKNLVLSDATAVFGSRFIPGGGDTRDENSNSPVVTIHKILSRILSQTGSSILNLTVTDLTSGYVAIRKGYFNSKNLRGNHGEYFIELACDLQRNGHRIIEIPYHLESRENGKSKSTNESFLGMMKTGWPYLRVLIRLCLQGSFRFRL